MSWEYQTSELGWMSHMHGSWSSSIAAESQTFPFHLQTRRKDGHCSHLLWFVCSGSWIQSCLNDSCGLPYPSLKSFLWICAASQALPLLKKPQKSCSQASEALSWIWMRASSPAQLCHGIWEHDSSWNLHGNRYWNHHGHSRDKPLLWLLTPNQDSSTQPFEPTCLGGSRGTSFGQRRGHASHCDTKHPDGSRSRFPSRKWQACQSWPARRVTLFVKD